jgi:hypothetical protein
MIDLDRPMPHCVLNEDYQRVGSNNITVKRPSPDSLAFGEQRVKPGRIIGRKFVAKVTHDTFEVQEYNDWCASYFMSAREIRIRIVVRRHSVGRML